MQSSAMKKTLQDISFEPGTVTLSIPAGWHELSPSQLRWLLRLLTGRDAGLRTEASVRITALLRFSGIKVIGRDKEQWLCRFPSGKFARVQSEQIALAARSMDWIMRPLPHPWRPDRIAGRRAVSSTLDDIPFGEFLALDNLYAGALSVPEGKAPGMIRRMARIMLRPGLLPLRLSPSHCYIIIQWFSAVKRRLARQYPFFYTESQADGTLSPEQGITPHRLRQAMDAQIRALTKGDITKEEKILSLPMERALTELNALAREYAELKAKK